MSEAKIVWHPYPKEKPKQTGAYLITVIPKGSKRVVAIGWYSLNIIEKSWTFHYGYCAGCSDEDVKAWSELPKPYLEKKNE